MIYISKPNITEEEKKAVLDVLESRILASNKKVELFEKNFADFHKVKYAICVSSGTAALQAGLVGASIGENDKILTTPFTFIATANSIFFTGAEVVFSDIDKNTYNLDSNKVEDILKKDNKIKAIMLVHLYGNACDMDDYVYLSNKYNVKIFEDCAQAVGAEYKNKLVGTFGDFSAFSFYATKNIMTGEGGMVLTNDDVINEKVRKFINHGRENRFLYTSIGYNFRMTDIQAAIGIEQLKKINSFIEKRKLNADFLIKSILNKKLDFIKLPYLGKNKKHVFHQFTIRIDENYRDKFVSFMNENGVNVVPIYPVPVHKQPFYENIKKYNLPIVEKISKEVVSLPVHTELTKDDLLIIVNTIERFKNCCM